MSVRVMTAVWELDLPDSEKLVLLALADSANDEGHCWPSMASLVRKCSKGERTVQGAIKSLVDRGHITRREVPGKGCNYSVHPRKDRAPAESAPAQGSAQTPAAAADKPLRTIIGTKVPSLAERAVTAWNEGPAKRGATRALKLDSARRKQLATRVKEHGEEAIFQAINGISASEHHCGKNDRHWRADIGWLLESPRNFMKALEKAPSEQVPLSEMMSDAERVAFLDANIALYVRMGRELETGPWRRELAALKAKVESHAA